MAVTIINPTSNYKWYINPLDYANSQLSVTFNDDTNGTVNYEFEYSLPSAPTVWLPWIASQAVAGTAGVNKSTTLACNDTVYASMIASGYFLSGLLLRIKLTSTHAVLGTGVANGAGSFGAYKPAFNNILPNDTYFGITNPNSLFDDSTINITWSSLYSEHAITGVDIYIKQNSGVPIKIVSNYSIAKGHYAWSCPKSWREGGNPANPLHGLTVATGDSFYIILTGAGTTGLSVMGSAFSIATGLQYDPNATVPYVLPAMFPAAINPATSFESTIGGYYSGDMPYPARKELMARVAIEKAKLVDEAIALAQVEAGDGIQIFQRDSLGKCIALNDAVEKIPRAYNLVYRVKHDAQRIPRPPRAIEQYLDFIANGTLVSTDPYNYGKWVYIDITHSWDLTTIGNSLFRTGQTKYSFKIEFEDVTLTGNSNDALPVNNSVLRWEALDGNTIRVYCSMKGQSAFNVSLSKDLVHATYASLYKFKYRLVEVIPRAYGTWPQVLGDGTTYKWGEPH